MGLIGFVFCVLGIGLAMLGRAYLDRNCGMPKSKNENAELVTTGPYALVRHPIYSGMLLAMLGSAIGQSVLWLLPLIVYGPHFILSARREETLLIEQCPERYRAYMKRTKMLLPFVLRNQNPGRDKLNVPSLSSDRQLLSGFYFTDGSEFPVRRTGVNGHKPPVRASC